MYCTCFISLYRPNLFTWPCLKKKIFKKEGKKKKNRTFRNKAEGETEKKVTNMPK